MNIFVFGDESGVFDKKNNDLFVFGGLVLLGTKQKDEAVRKYRNAEKTISGQYETGSELKASSVSYRHRDSLFRATNQYVRYAFVIDQKTVNDSVFDDKKTKQRYLDYVYKVGLKKVMTRLINGGRISPSDVDNIYVRFDEHSTATNGRYELREAIESEFKHGTHNFRYNCFHPPIFPGMRGTIDLQFRDSAKDPLVRASDIVANRVWSAEIKGVRDRYAGKIFCVEFP